MYDPTRPAGEGSHNLRFGGQHSRDYVASVDSPVDYSEGKAYNPLAPVDAEQRKGKWRDDNLLNLPSPTAQVRSAHERIGYTMLEQLPQLVGHRWDNVARAAVETLRPSCVRLAVKGQRLTEDSVWWRVTVHMEEGYIVKVVQEVKVYLPNSCANGQQFRTAMMYDRKLPDAEKPAV